MGIHLSCSRGSIHSNDVCILSYKGVQQDTCFSEYLNNMWPMLCWQAPVLAHILFIQFWCLLLCLSFNVLALAWHWFSWALFATHNQSHGFYDWQDAKHVPSRGGNAFDDEPWSYGWRYALSYSNWWLFSYFVTPISLQHKSYKIYNVECPVWNSACKQWLAV